MAAYFAIEDAESERCAVWAFDAEWARAEGGLRLAKFRNKPATEIITGDEYLSLILWGDTSEASVEGVFVVEPFHLNERIAVQQGVFLIPGNPDHSFENNLLSHNQLDVRNSVVKVVIPAEARLDALSELQRMNIHRGSLFPGLDGFARSLEYQLAIQEVSGQLWRSPEQNAKAVFEAIASHHLFSDWDTLTTADLAEVAEQLTSKTFEQAGFKVEARESSTGTGPADLLVSSKTGRRHMIQVRPIRVTGARPAQSVTIPPELMDDPSDSRVLALVVFETGDWPTLYVLRPSDIRASGLFVPSGRRGGELRAQLLDGWKQKFDRFRAPDAFAHWN